MLTIRQEQLDVFNEMAQKEFWGRVAAYLRKHLPQLTQALAEEELLAKIRGCQIRAAVYGVVTERGIAKWCLLSMLTNEAFHDQPEIHQYLSEPQPDPAAKIDTLVDALYIRMRQAETYGGE